MSKIIPNSTTVNNGQNGVDLAIQEMGSIEGMVALLRQNNLSVNSDPAVGTVLDVAADDIVDARNRTFFKDRKVNTGIYVGDISIGIFDFTFDLTYN